MTHSIADSLRLVDAIRSIAYEPSHRSTPDDQMRRITWGVPAFREAIAEKYRRDYRDLAKSQMGDTDEPPWPRLTAPWRFASRVMSRITDSVNDDAFFEGRRSDMPVP